MCMCVATKADVNTQAHVNDLYLHTGITIQFSMDTFSFNESDGSGYVEVTASSTPASDFMFTLSQGELGFSQSLSSLPVSY